MKTNYRVLEYKKGFRKHNGKMVYGLNAMFQLKLYLKQGDGNPAHAMWGR